jgi:hypothetical protein
MNKNICRKLEVEIMVFFKKAYTLMGLLLLFQL